MQKQDTLRSLEFGSLFNATREQNEQIRLSARAVITFAFLSNEQSCKLDKVSLFYILAKSAKTIA